MMQASNKPAEIQLILDEIDARQSRAVARTVRGHEQHAGDELHGEHKNEATAPDIAPLGTPRNVLDQQSRHQPTIARSVVAPVAKFSQHPLTLGYGGWRGLCEGFVLYLDA